MIGINFPVTELLNSAKNDANTYLVSICIPTFNRVSDLKVCLGSLLAKYGNSCQVEIVVIDNGSSDGTSYFLNENCNSFTNTSFYIRKFNSGYDVNLLDCYYRAKGSYVHFLGDDDLIIFKSFDDLILLLEKDEPDLVISEYTITTSRKTFNAVNKQGKKFDEITDLLSYVGHHLTFMSLITLKKQPAEIQYMYRYTNFKFMHISLILEVLSGKCFNLIFLSNPIVAATDTNYASYDVAEYFMIDLIRSFQLNIKKLDLVKLQPFFVSVLCHCIESNVSLIKVVPYNAIIAIAGFKCWFNPKLLKSFLMRTVRKTAKKVGLHAGGR